MIEITWPGAILVVLLGVLMGAGMAFFRARTWKALARFLALGIAGVVIGQVIAAYVPIHLFHIGVVDIEYGIGMAALFLYMKGQWQARHRRRAPRSAS